MTPPPMATCEKVKANQKRQKTLEHRVIVEQLLGEVELILWGQIDYCGCFHTV